MDGVIYHGNVLLPGVKEFIEWLQKNQKKFLFLTNNSAPTPRELSQKLARLGLSIGEEHFYTSAIATAKFLQSQKPKGGSVYVIGEPGLHYALYEHGFTMNEQVRYQVYHTYSFYEVTMVYCCNRTPTSVSSAKETVTTLKK